MVNETKISGREANNVFTPENRLRFSGTRSNQALLRQAVLEEICKITTPKEQETTQPTPYRRNRWQ
jgi:hypothetical protein